MENKDFIEELDKAIATLDDVEKKLKKILDDLVYENDYKKCDACGEYVPDDHIVDFYGENICLDCRGNGYGS